MRGESKSTVKSRLPGISPEAFLCDWQLYMVSMLLDGGVRECDGTVKGGGSDALSKKDEQYPARAEEVVREEIIYTL